MLSVLIGIVLGVSVGLTINIFTMPIPFWRKIVYLIVDFVLVVVTFYLIDNIIF